MVRMLIIFLKSSSIGVWQGPKYANELSERELWCSANYQFFFFFYQNDLHVFTDNITEQRNKTI